MKVLGSLFGSAILVSGLVLAQVPAATSATQTESLPLEVLAKVRILVRQLDHMELAKRVAAERELIELGPVVLEFLPEVTPRTAAEVKTRLDRIRATLEAAAVEAATQPSLITLEGQMPLTAALAAIEKQSGNKIVDFRPRFGQQQRDPMVQVDFNKTPFWQALDQTLDQAGLTVYSFVGESGTLAVVSKSEGETARESRGDYAGLFRIEPTQIVAQRDLRNPANESLRLTLEVAWEPRMTPIVLEQALDQVVATGSDGQAIRVDGSQGKVEVPVQANVISSNMELPLQLPGRDVESIKSVKGQLSALVPGRVETFKFTDLGKATNVEQRRAGVAVILERTFKNVELYEIRIRVQFDKAANALESHRGWIYNNEAYLLDKAGERVENAGFELTRQEINEVGLSYKFVLEKGLQGHTFVYKTPAAIVKMPVPFELKNIQLP